MSERKAINKYYPPDFDPSKVKKVKKIKKTGRASWPTVRLMAPFSMKCLQCNEYIAQSRKFNARKEVTEEKYLGSRILRFHIRCPRCNSELIFRTDPKNADYECVSGCKRNYERSTAKPNEGPKAAKNETFDQMLERLEKEDEIEQLNKDGKQKASEETGIEQLEKRLREQEREQQLIDEIDDLQQKNKQAEKRKEEVMKIDLQGET
ncbi:unnamed protein product [Ambrosiozyma monospora]|uniref:Unnamed protein product n=1 Tax=Ambrosiozyma monospora TaxID=43982 RepID=A0ACB5TAA8_AMBMO|nr:unnamed protein product [Ambrosiozyma monospora]